MSRFSFELYPSCTDKSDHLMATKLTASISRRIMYSNFQVFECFDHHWQIIWWRSGSELDQWSSPYRASLTFLNYSLKHQLLKGSHFRSRFADLQADGYKPIDRTIHRTKATKRMKIFEFRLLSERERERVWRIRRTQTSILKSRFFLALLMKTIQNAVSRQREPVDVCTGIIA